MSSETLEENTNDIKPDIHLSWKLPASSETLEENTNDIKPDIHLSWKLPAIAQFVSLFFEDFKLPEVEIEELEDGFLQTSELGSKTLQKLLFGLVKGVMRGANADNYEIFLTKLVKKIGKEENIPEITSSENVLFADLTLSTKLDIFHSICCRRLLQADAQEILKKMDADTLRVQPLGSDDSGNEYWYFYGTRLYRQEATKQKKTKSWEEEWDTQKRKSFGKRRRGRPRKLVKSDEGSDEYDDSKNFHIEEKSRWSVVCNTMEDWVEFAEKFKNSKSDAEKSLFKTVTFNFLPTLNEIYLEKERKLQQKLKDLIPARRIVTRTETRKHRIKSLGKDLSEEGLEDAHKKYLARERATRLEERNHRRLNGDEHSRSPSLKSGRRGRRSRIRYDDPDEDEESLFEEEEMDEEFMSEENEHTDELPAPSLDCSPTCRNLFDIKSRVIKVLSDVKLQKDAWPFLQPVDEACAPAYYEIISEPMDLSTISDRLQNDAYDTIAEMDNDFRKMVNNCKNYNGPKHEMSRMVTSLWKVFRKGVSSFSDCPFVDEMTEEEQSIKVEKTRDPQPRRKRKRAAHLEALERMSQEAELAVERCENSDAQCFRQTVSHSKEFSSLKIITINNHPSSLIEKFSSDSSSSSNDDQDKSLSPGALPDPVSEEQSGKSASSSPLLDNGQSSDAELSVFMDKNDPKSFADLLDDADLQQPQINNEFSALEGANQQESQFLQNSSGDTREGRSNPSVSSIMSTLLGDVTIPSPGRGATIESTVRTSPNKGVPFTSEGFGVSDFRELAAVDSSVLSYTSSTNSCSSSTTFRKQMRSQSLQTSTATHEMNSSSSSSQDSRNRQRYTPPFAPIHPMLPSIAAPPKPNDCTLPPLVHNFPALAQPPAVATSAGMPLQSPSYNKAFPQPKVPALKLTLPRSSREILMMPSEQASPNMTFHMFTPTSPLQSAVEVQTEQHNQQQDIVVVDNNELSAKRKSPIQLMQPAVFSGPVMSSEMRPLNTQVKYGNPIAAVVCSPETFITTHPTTMVDSSRFHVTSSKSNESSLTVSSGHVRPLATAVASDSFRTLCPKTAPMLFRSFNPPQQQSSPPSFAAFGAAPAPYPQPKTAVLMCEGEKGKRPVTTTAAPFFPTTTTSTMPCGPAYPNVAPLNSPVFTQVQIPQYLGNSPYYIVADPNSMQNPARYPFMNVQPVPFPSR